MVTCEESTEPVAVFDAEGLAEAFASLPAALGPADALAARASHLPRQLSGGEQQRKGEPQCKAICEFNGFQVGVGVFLVQHLLPSTEYRPEY